MSLRPQRLQCMYVRCFSKQERDLAAEHVLKEVAAEIGLGPVALRQGGMQSRGEWFERIHSRNATHLWPEPTLPSPVTTTMPRTFSTPKPSTPTKNPPAPIDKVPPTDSTLQGGSEEKYSKDQVGAVQPRGTRGCGAHNDALTFG